MKFSKFGNLPTVEEFLVKGSLDENSEDIWDDTILIQAWDNTSTKMKILSDSEKEENKEDDLVNGGDTLMNDSSEIIVVASSDTISNSTGTKRTTSKQKIYHVGQHVRAIYSLDNQEYEAVITKVSQGKESCVVKFVGYGNKEEVFMTDLKKSQGKGAIENQIIQARLDSQEIESDSEKEENKEDDLVNGGDTLMNDSSEIVVASSDTISNPTGNERTTSKQKILSDSEKEENKEDDLVNGGDTLMNDSSEIDVASSDTISNSTGNERTTSKQKKYHVGQHIRAIYFLDNQEYEAVITKVSQWTDTCTVEFVGYGNKEEVFMTDLKKSQGKGAIENQIIQARLDSQEDANSEDIWDDTELIEMWDKSMAPTKIKILSDSEKEENKEDDLVNGGDTLMNDSSEIIVVASSDTISNSTGTKRTTSKQKIYHVGQHVRAIYSLDNQEYEAVITKVSQGKESCVVKFVGYGNKEEVFMTDLKKSQGKGAIENQIIQARLDSQEEDSNVFDNYKDEDNKMELEYEEPQFNAPIAETRNINCGLRSRPNKQVKTDQSHYRPQIPPVAQLHRPPVVPSIIPPPLIHRTHSEQEAFTSMLMSWYLNGYHTGYYEGLNHDRKASKSSRNKQRNPTSYYTKK